MSNAFSFSALSRCRHQQQTAMCIFNLVLLLTLEASTEKQRKTQMSLHRFQQLFPFRSSIVKNENVTEKGMTKKSWKAVFHKHTEHMRARENVPRSTFLFLLLHGEPEVACRDVRVAEWGCFALLFFSCCRSNDLCWNLRQYVCVCRVLCCCCCLWLIHFNKLSFFFGECCTTEFALFPLFQFPFN